MKRKYIFSVTTIIIVLTISFILLEIILRIAGLGYGNAPLESDPIFHHVHPANYRFVVHTPDNEYGGHTVYYNSARQITNPDSYVRKKGAPCKIAFLGDSFTEAAQVDYKKSFVGILSEHTTCEVLNFGTSSYSPIFYELQWRRLVEELKPTLVIVQLFSNDISSDSEYFKVAKFDKNGDVLAIPGPEGGKFISLMRKMYLLRFLRKTQLKLKWMLQNEKKEINIIEGVVEENPEISSLSSKFMSQLAENVKESGAEFSFFVIPSKFRLINKTQNEKHLEFSDRWKQWAINHNISFIDLVQPFKEAAMEDYQLFYNLDIHLNENGNLIPANEIAKKYPNIFQDVKVNILK